MGDFRRVWLRLVVLTAVLTGGFPAMAAGAADSLQIGWQGHVHLGQWTPVRVPAVAGAVRDMVTIDPNGYQVEWGAESAIDGTYYVRFGRPEAQLSVRVGESGTVLESNAESLTVLPANGRLILTVGTLKGFEFAESDRNAGTFTPHYVVALESASELPTDPRGYESVAHLVLSGLPELSEAQSAALRTWVGQGGRLVLALPVDPARLKSSPLAAWLPFTVADEPIQIRGVGRLEAVSGKNVRIPLPQRQMMMNVKAPDGVILAAEREDLLLARIPYAFGVVTVLSLELPRLPLTGDSGKSPLGRWLALPDFCRQLVESPQPNPDEFRKTRRLGTQLSSTGITDLASQLHAVQEHFPDVRRTTPWPAMGWMLTLIAVLAAADYGVVHLLLKRPQATWVTLPVMIALACGLSAWAAESQNGARWQTNVLEVVDVDASTSTARVQAWVDVYSPVTQRRSVDLQPARVEWLRSGPSAGAWPAALTWEGVPETVFGGMYRPGGPDLNSARYRVTGSGNLKDVPWLQWSTQALTSRWSAEATLPVEATLKYVGVGRLSGTLRNVSGTPLEDWMIAYGNRLYRRLKDRDADVIVPLNPDEVWDLDGPNVSQREIRSVLTRTRSSLVARRGEKTTDVRTEQGRYDPLDLDPTDLIRLLTFHEEIGGTGYTGLSNHPLEDRDATRQLELHRAVLFAHVGLPMSQVSLDGVEVVPDRRSTYLRVVLPVVRTSDEIRYLPKLE